MKEIRELELPEDLLYAVDHEWCRREGDLVRVGISDYAQDQLGDVVYVELPVPGDRIAKGDPFGTVESVKAVSELFLPLAGTIVESNRSLNEAPERVNDSPYGDGWMVLVQPAQEADLGALMDRDTYRKHLEGI